MSLFREEALARKSVSLHGAINLAVPISWHWISACLVSVLAVIAIFLFSASYSRSEIASGSIVPDQGILQIVPSRVGQVLQVHVQDGQFVRRGAVLATIRVEGADRFGAGSQASVISSIDRQERGIAEQQALAALAGSAQQAEYEAGIDGLRREMESLDNQISVQQKLVDMAQASFAQASKIAERGFISQRDLAIREETLLTRQQQILGLRQARAAKLSSIEQLKGANRLAAVTAAGNAAALTVSRAQAERERATAKREQEYSLIAPKDGQVAALNIHVGDAVNAQESAIAIVPSQSELVARLLVPGKAVGFVKVGQRTRLGLDAFPQERFGPVNCIIKSVSSAPIIQPGQKGGSEPFYVSIATIEGPEIMAYGRRERLRPGMTFTARIITERRSLVEWLFDPLLAVAGR